MSKLPFETNYLSINQYQTSFHHNSLHTHQLDHLQQLVELTEKIFKIAVAFQLATDASVHHMISDDDIPGTIYTSPELPWRLFRNATDASVHHMISNDDIPVTLNPPPEPPWRFFRNVYNATDASVYHMISYQSAKLYDIMSHLENIDAMRQLLKDIRNISYEMSCNLLEGTGNVDKTTSTVLEKLQNYSWDEKTILTVVAFAFNILELSMLMKHCDRDQMMKLLQKVKGHHLLKLDLDALDKLEMVIKGMMDVVSTNMTFLREGICLEEASSSIDNRNPPRRKEATNKMIHEEATNKMIHEEATNKMIRIVLELSTTLSKREDRIVDRKLEWIATEIININSVLKETLARCKHHAAGIPGLVHLPYEDGGKPMPKISTSELIRKIKKYIQIEDYEKLENRHVLYLVSNLDISTEEIKVLKGLYKKNKQMYEMVWLPIVDSSSGYGTEREYERFRELKQMTEWICVEEPLKNNNTDEAAAQVIGYVKKDWEFRQGAIAVSVNQEAEITCFNALPMLWTWGNAAFPFTEKQERNLWSIIDEQRDVDPLAKLVHKGKGRHHPLKLDFDALDKLGTVINGLIDVVHTNLIFLRDSFSRVKADEVMAFLHTEATNGIIPIVLEISTTLSKREDQIVGGELLRLARQLIILNTVLHESLTRSEGYSLRSLTEILKLLKSLDTFKKIKKDR